MRLSTERILTTHTGSLPRPQDLPSEISERSPSQLADAVRSVVASQIDAGVDVVNDGIGPVAYRDCGFATFGRSSTVHPEVAWAKLATMAEGARLASRRLWP